MQNKKQTVILWGSEFTKYAFWAKEHNLKCYKYFIWGIESKENKHFVFG